MGKKALKRATAAFLTGAMAISLAACGSTSDTSSSGSDSSSTESSSTSDSGAADGVYKYTDIELGTTGTDIKTSIKLLTQRTDMLEDDYAGTSYPKYIEEFNKMYPDIEVNVEGITDYAEDSLLRLQGGEDWGDIMMIPAVAKEDLSSYFTPYGTKDDVATQVKYINNWTYEGNTYGIPSTANAQGIVYNKKIFSDAGITSLPTTPDEFIADLQKVKDNTDAIPLYTNYAAGWTLGSWAVPQMQGAGDNGADIGYMPFPITVDGKMFASSGPDYQFGINCKASVDNQNAAMIFVKWMTEKSGFSYNEGGLPIATDDDKVPDLYSEFTDMNVTYLEDDPAKEGEEGLMDLLNQDSELAINAGGNDKVANIIESAATGSESFNDIMNDWNQKWSDAQSTEGVEVQ